jgi:uncharacterized protein (DUF983 family)
MGRGRSRPNNVPDTAVTLLHASLRCRCPRCGKGKLYTGLVTLRPACPVCGLDYGKSDTGDAGAVGLIIVLGAIVIVMAFWVEFHFNPPLWVHAVLWPAVTFPLTILLMRPMKAFLVASQYFHRPNAMGL